MLGLPRPVRSAHKATQKPSLPEFHALEPRLLLSATPTEIARALDLPDGVTPAYTGDAQAVQMRALNTTAGLLGFPSGRDEDFLLFSSGIASQMDTLANTSGSQGTDLGDGGATGDTATISFSLSVPASSQQQKFKFDFIFLSDEYPEYVGSQYNDFFTATVNGTNIALDQVGNVVSVNNVLFDGSLATTGTFFDGRTSMLTATYTIPDGVDTLNVVFSVGDVGDGIYDSGVIVDNVRIEVGQIVWLNFEGQADLTHGGATWDMPTFQPTDLGYANNDNRATLISEIVSAVEGHYAGLDLTVTTTQPTEGDYSTVHIGGNDTPLYGGPGTLFGQADHVDIDNRVKVDDAVVFSREFGSFYGTGMGEDADTVRDRIAVTITHELAHNLGLRHVDNTYNEDIMKKNSPRDSTAVFGDELKDLPAVEQAHWPDDAQKQNDMEVLRAVLGTTGTGTSLTSSYSWLWNMLNQWFTFNLDASKALYDVTIGTGEPMTVDPVTGIVDGDVAPQTMHFDVLDGTTQLQLANYSGQDQFFLMGATKQGGPIDVTTGQLNDEGEVDLYSAMVDIGEEMDVSKVSKGELKPYTTGGLTESEFTDLDWLGKKGTTFEDADGDLYTVSVKNGQAAVVLDDADGDGKGSIQTIVLQDTTDKSALSIKVKQNKETGDGLVSIGSIQGTGQQLKSIAADDCDLVGTGIDFDGGFLGGVKLHDILNGADVNGGGTAEQASYFSAATVGDDSSITFGSNLKSFAATDVGTGDITANTIKSLKVAEDFASALLLLGLEGTVLKSAAIGGTLDSASINTDTGDIGKVTLGAMLNSEIFVGYTGGGLPTTPEGFNTPASLAGLTIKGLDEADNMSGCEVVAAHIGKIALSFPGTGNTFVSDTIGGLSVTHDDGEDGTVKESWKSLDDPADSLATDFATVTLV